MRRGKRELLVVGDRVLIEPDQGETRTQVGLILPANAVEKEAVQGGRVVALGPGTPLPPPDADLEEPWSTNRSPRRYMPMEPRIGDFALFFRKAAIEISFESERYLVVPQGAILVLVRDRGVPDVLPDEIA